MCFHVCECVCIGVFECVCLHVLCVCVHVRDNRSKLSGDRVYTLSVQLICPINCSYHQ